MARFTKLALRFIAGLGSALLISFAAQAQQQPDARPDGPLFTPEQMKQGIVMTARDCAAYRATVYVVATGTGLCFRYYLSTAGGDSADAVYFLQGDQPDDQLAYDPAALDRIAETMSKGYRRPAIYLARMGTDGSSGSQRNRRTWLEVAATHLAIDAINARHGFRMVHVMGQSGGGHLTAALVGTRTDVGCAVPGSGRLAFDQEYLARQAKRPFEQRHYSPDSALPQVVVNSHRTRILVVTDPNDQRVPAHMQTGFVRAVSQAGGRIAQFFVTATDELSHGAVVYTRKAMAGCLAGKPDGEIAATLDQMSRERWAAKIVAKSAAAEQSGPRAPAPHQPPPPFGAGARPAFGQVMVPGPMAMSR